MAIGIAREDGSPEDLLPGGVAVQCRRRQEARGHAGGQEIDCTRSRAQIFTMGIA